MDQDTPTYNLKAVVQETGIKPDTLRAWERRYGLPAPDRSGGGHRLYSQRDIDTLLWLMARQDEGLTISRAVDLWHTLEADGRDPLRMPEYTAHRSEPHNVNGEEINVLHRQWVEACLHFDERTAERILAQAFAIYPVEAVCVDLLQKGLRTIGELWYEGTASVQQEHFASALAMRRIDAMLGAAPLPNRVGRILIACPPGEEHVFGQAMIQLMLRRRGWETIYLGANVPLERLESSVEMMRPHLVVLTAQRLETAANLREMAMLLQERNISVGYGGRIFKLIPQLRRRIPGHYLGDDLAGSVNRIEDLIPVSPALPEQDPISQETRRLTDLIRARGMDIAATTSRLIRESDLPSAATNSANMGMGGTMLAALEMGGIHLIDADINWTEAMLEHHGFSSNQLANFLLLYAQAIEQTIGEQADGIVQWLRTKSQEIQTESQHGQHQHRRPDERKRRAEK
jgi:methanogenic corrinoid protein MtbC1